MKSYQIIFITVLFSILLVLFGCTNNTSDNEKNNELGRLLSNKNPKLVVLNERLFSLPSPLEISTLVSKANLEYNSAIVNIASNTANYTTSFKQAVNLGIFGADLGYMNIYNQMPDLASYFAALKVLSKELGILSFLNPELLNRFEINKGNKDSLIYLVGLAYRMSDTFLINNERSDVAVLILAGGWIESVHFLISSLETNKNQLLINRLGEQKYTLNSLIDVMRPYYNHHSDAFDAFFNQLIELAYVFDGVDISYSYKKPIIDVENKTTIIKSETKTTITDYQYTTIKTQLEEIRNSLIN